MAKQDPFQQTIILDRFQIDLLGRYIYALIDPRDGSIFYIGQGRNMRIGDHFDEARQLLKGRLSSTKKRERIIEIWKSGNEVTPLFLARMLPSDEVTDIVETALISAGSHSANGVLFNQQEGPAFRTHGMMTYDALKAKAALPVDPTSPYPCVFIFNIAKEYARSADAYLATRHAWEISAPWRDQPACAVGLINGVCYGAYRIRQWRHVEKKRWAFEKQDTEDMTDFLFKNWSRILQPSFGYWQRGRHLIVEFDGDGRFRTLLGNKDKTRWYPTLESVDSHHENDAMSGPQISKMGFMRVLARMAGIKRR